MLRQHPVITPEIELMMSNSCAWMRDSRDFAMDGEYTAFTFILLITIEEVV